MDHGLYSLVPFLPLEYNKENYIWNRHWVANYLINRSSRSQMFFKRGLLKDFENSQIKICGGVSF